MDPRTSATDLLVLHGVRLLGMAEGTDVGRRFGLDAVEVSEVLLDFEARGWVRHDEFAGTGGWSLTDAGRRINEQLLAQELHTTGVAAAVQAVHAAFLPLNARFQHAVTRWQVHPLPGDTLAANDHTDHRWDDRVLQDLASVGRRLKPLAEDLEGLLARFSGYATRYGTALARVERGERRWVDDMSRDSCHRVWFELHEDLIASLGLARGDEGR